MANTEMVIDSIRVELRDYRRAVILKDKAGDRYFHIWVGDYEADAIAAGLSKVNGSAFVHVFVYSIISKLGATLKYVLINKFIRANFHAKVFIERGSDVFEIDCRPSDAIVIALRASAPIFVTEEIVKTVWLTSSEIDKIFRVKKD